MSGGQSCEAVTAAVDHLKLIVIGRVKGLKPAVGTIYGAWQMI